MHFQLLFATAFLVALRAFQSQNVIYGHYVLATLTSYAMAIGEVAIILSVMQTGLDSIPWMGTGAAIGVTTAMYIHRTYVQKIKVTAD